GVQPNLRRERARRCPFALHQQPVALLEDRPLPAARLAEEVRRRAQREKRTALGKGVDQRLGPPLSGLDAVVVEEADFLLAPRAGEHAHLCAEIAVEALDVNVVVATGIAEKEIKHASSDRAW